MDVCIVVHASRYGQRNCRLHQTVCAEQAFELQQRVLFYRVIVKSDSRKAGSEQQEEHSECC